MNSQISKHDFIPSEPSVALTMHSCLMLPKVFVALVPCQMYEDTEYTYLVRKYAELIIVCVCQVHENEKMGHGGTQASYIRYYS